jgi:hypothetical protein
VILADHPEIEFEGFENTIPGTLIHQYIQDKVLLTGMEILQRYIVVGHEQACFCKVNGRIRWSHADTLLWNFVEQYREIWDYKSEAYVDAKRTDAKNEHMVQVNLYAYLHGAKFYGIVYIDKKKYSTINVYRYPMDPELAKKTLERMAILDKLKKKETSMDYKDMAEAIYLDPKHTQCSWCQCAKKETPYCLEHFQQAFGKPFRSLNEVRAILGVMGEVKEDGH